jgi:hypothetical protein
MCLHRAADATTGTTADSATHLVHRQVHGDVAVLRLEDEDAEQEREEVDEHHEAESGVLKEAQADEVSHRR